VILVAPAVSLAGRPVQVVVSIEPYRWLVEQIGGSEIEVEVLVAAGESAESYQPTDAQVTNVMQADVYFRTGVAFERGLWFDAIEQMGRFEMVDLRDGVDLRPHDPHVWLSPPALSIQAANVAATLVRFDPDRGAVFRSNLERLQRRLDELDAGLHELLAPHAGKPFFVFHPSWGYFADRYGLEQVAIEIDGQVPTDRELTDLQRRAKQSGTVTVFVQPQIHGEVVRAFAATIGARVETLDPLAADVIENLRLSAAKLVVALEGVTLR
jgi:zinc transport system substrate-binding protein